MVEEEDTDWTTARVIFGTLTGIDKQQEEITLEYKDGDEWINDTFSTDGWTEDDYQELRGALGKDINVTVEDSTVLEWVPAR
jgi:hypothetical protein